MVVDEFLVTVISITITFIVLQLFTFFHFAEPVQVTGQSENINVPLGEDVELWCEFRGTPSPEVQWYFKGRPVSDTNMITTNPSNRTEHGRTTLIVNNIQFEDIGDYQCVLSNHLQSVHQEVNVCGEGGPTKL